MDISRLGDYSGIHLIHLRITSCAALFPCPVWLRYRIGQPFTETNRADFIIQHLDLQPGMQAWDFGC
ncbi:MAG: hypothetical protein U0Z26_01270 [Anaerolineales bacterium]